MDTLDVVLANFVNFEKDAKTFSTQSSDKFSSSFSSSLSALSCISGLATPTTTTTTTSAAAAATASTDSSIDTPSNYPQAEQSIVSLMTAHWEFPLNLAFKHLLVSTQPATEQAMQPMHIASTTSSEAATSSSAEKFSKVSAADHEHLHVQLGLHLYALRTLFAVIRSEYCCSSNQ